MSIFHQNTNNLDLALEWKFPMIGNEMLEMIGLHGNNYSSLIHVFSDLLVVFVFLDRLFC